MYVLAGLGGLGVLVALGLTAMGIAQRRVPLAVWLLVPLLALSVGAIGAWMGSGTALAALDSASAEVLPSMAKSGYASALLPDWFGRWVGAGLMVLAAWGAGLGAALRGDEDSRTTWFSAVMAAVVAIATAVGCAVFAATKGLGTPGFAIAAVIGFGGIGVAVGSFRRHLHDHAFRVAGMRFASGLALIFAVSWAGKAVLLGNSIDLANKLSSASGASYAEFLQAGVSHGADLATLGWIALVGAWVIALFAFFAELGDVVQKGTLFDMFGVILLLLFTFSVRLVEGTATETLKAVSDLGPLADVIDELGYDLPGSMAYDPDGNIQNARPTEGGFGDVLLWSKDDGWGRAYTWNGQGWTKEAKPVPLANLQLSDKKVLLVAVGDAPGKDLFEPLEKAGGEALLLARVEELSGSDDPEVVARDGVLFPITLDADGPDFTEELWMDGDKGKIYEGPVQWYGEGWDARKLYQRLAAAYAVDELAEGETPPEPQEGEATPNPRKNLHVVVGERMRVRSLLEECAPVITHEVDGKYVGNGKLCEISTVEVPEDADPKEVTAVTLTVDKAMEGWEPPEPKNLRMSYDVPRELDREIVSTVLDREIGAFAYCGTILGPEAEVEGLHQTKIYIDMSGVINSYSNGERTKLESPEITDCVRSRLRPMRFSKHEIEEEDKMPYITLNLDYRQ